MSASALSSLQSATRLSRLARLLRFCPSLLLCLCPLLRSAGTEPKNTEASAITSALTWTHGLEGQRKADLGDGRFLNPVLPGDHADPSVLKDGQDYYLVNSSFESTPGLLVWHSRDLVNWEPLGPALHTPVGSVWAPDLCKVGKRYYIYFPALNEKGLTNMVVWADSPRGPWSDPVDLKIGNIDPGHVVDDKGNRFLFMSAGYMLPLAADGLSAAGPATKVYDGWKYPESWDVEVFAQEGPKMLHHGDYYYMILAEGGTAGPATSHMVIMARSRTLQGPWENAPCNPIVHTASSAEPWWSRGHATLVEGPDGKQWYLVYHGYEKGHYNLGRQTLLEPVEWTADGWLRAQGGDLSRPMPIPAGGSAVPHGLALSNHLTGDTLPIQFALFHARAGLNELVHPGPTGLALTAGGGSPKDGTVLCAIAGDQNYELEVEADIDEGSSAGLLLFYSDRLFAGLGLNASQVLEYSKGDCSPFALPASLPADTDRHHVWLRLRLSHDVVTCWYSHDGRQWTRHWMQFEVSGYHHNVAGGFLSLRPALYAGGKGQVRFRHFRYQALP